MRLKFIIAIIAILIQFNVVGQVVQNGVVKEYNEKAEKTPLSGVELNVRSAGSTISDRNGGFSLKFLTLKPGEKVSVRRIEKLGYELFNKEAIEQWNLNPKNPFVIVMCRSDKFKKIRDNYERVSSESYARQLKKEKAALEKLKKDGILKEEDYQRQLLELRENYEQQLDNLNSYVDRFSRIDLSELSITEQKIIELVQAGKIDEAIAKYEEQNYAEKYAQEVAELKEVSHAMKQLSIIHDNKKQSRDSLLAAINRQIGTLKIAGGRENFEKIGQLLHDVAFADTTDISQLVAYSYYLIDQKKNNEALTILQIIKKARDSEAKCDASHSKCIAVRRNIGNVYFNMGDFSNAEHYYLDAIKLCNEYSWSDKSYIEAHLEYCEAELGRLYSTMKSFGKSEALLLSTLDRKLKKYKSDKNDYTIFELTNVCRELSAFYSKKQEFTKAIQYGIMGLDYFNEMSSKDDEEKIRLYADISSDVAVANYYVSDIESAIKYAVESLNSRKELYEFNPERYGIGLAMSYGNLGSMYSMVGNKEKAFDNTKSSYKLIAQLHSNNPNAYAKEYAMATYNLATEYMDRSDYMGGLELISDMLPTLEKLYESYPSAYAKFYVESLHVTALFEHKTESYEKCNSHLDQALLLIEQVEGEQSISFLEPKINIFVLKGDTYEKMGLYKNAKENYIRAIEQAGLAESFNPTSFLVSRISAYYNLGLLLKRLGEADDAIRIFTQAKEKFSQYGVPQLELVLYNLAETYLSINSQAKALDVIEDGLNVFPNSEGLLHLKKSIGAAL